VEVRISSNKYLKIRFLHTAPPLGYGYKKDIGKILKAH